MAASSSAHPPPAGASCGSTRRILTPFSLSTNFATLPSRRSTFCLENRITRELFWAGFGFQIWCQLLTHIARAQDSPYLWSMNPSVFASGRAATAAEHLRDIGPDVLLATHSTEIIGDADPSEIVLAFDKTTQSAQRLRDVAGIQNVLEKVGSIQNVTLTRLARNRRILFVEDEED